MSDHLTPKQRHKCMASIRSKNTKPEVKLRKELFKLGYRYRLNVNSLPGKPDIVLPKYRTCIFVNGCFWHGHKGCSKFVMPKTRTDFWTEKITNNRERDLRDYQALESKGWRVIVVWECEMEKSSFVGTIESVCRELESNRQSWLDEVADRRRRREEWRAVIRRRKDRLLEQQRQLRERNTATLGS